jgi:predicted  nucleic acid-binding Zn-ribbon protein
MLDNNERVEAVNQHCEQLTEAFNDLKEAIYRLNNELSTRLQKIDEKQEHLYECEQLKRVFK